MLTYCCLTEPEVVSLIEKIYDIVDCCSDITDDTLNLDIDFDYLEDFYD